MAAPLNLSPLNVPALLRTFSLHPKKRLGQNFLLDETALQRVAAAAEIGPQAVVLEVGPGLGSLSRHLARAARRVVAVELDRALFPVLRAVLSPFSNVTLVQGDILALDPAALAGEAGYLVVANIPYYITSALIRHLLEAPLKPSRLVLTVQKEVAARLCARPGEMSLLALGVQVYGAPRLVGHIPATAFYPAPDINSSIVRVDLYPEPLIPLPVLETFFSLARAGFGQKRKTLRNALSSGLHLTPDKIVSLLAAAEIDPQRRAETLSLEEWGRLTETYLSQ